MNLSNSGVAPMLPVFWRAEAQADFSAILEYIAARNPTAAVALYDDIERTIAQLPLQHHLYRVGRVTGTREIVAHPNYIVVYRIGAAAIEIVSILHSRQKYP